MNNMFFKNGFIVKSYQEQPFANIKSKYMGIGRYQTWPLEYRDDPISVQLSEEANERWFGYGDGRLYAVPNLDYLYRYIKHCNALKILTFCMQIESNRSIVTTAADVPIDQYLGYDYADVDLSTSCLFEDLNMTLPYCQDQFKLIKQQLNKYELVDSLEVMQEYLRIRNQLIYEGYDMEEYFSPTIVKLSIISLSQID